MLEHPSVLLISCVIIVVCCLQQPQIILLKEGTDTSQGKAQLISNINACVAVVDAVRTTLGPRGMDKLIHTERVTPLLQFTADTTQHCKLLCSGQQHLSACRVSLSPMTVQL